MSRFLPKSLAGQMALLIGIALLLAQLVNFALLLNERQKLSLAQSETPAITRFVSAAVDVANGEAGLRRDSLRRPSRRLARFSVDPGPLVLDGAARRENTEARLRQALAAAGVPVRDVRAALGPVRTVAFEVSDGGGNIRAQRDLPPRQWRRRDIQMLHLSAQLGTGEWLNARVVTPRRDPLLTARLAVSTLLLYLFVLGASLLIAARLARPLRELTSAAERFEGKGDPVHVEPRGPDDLRHAILAFNAMSRRVTRLLDEKDRMLGAIGHDLRTPLASLRIRAESMESDEERDRMIATIEEMTAMLEDILVLARSGRSREEARAVDLAALVDALVEEQAELGHPVRFIPSARQVASVRPTLLRRAVRNLIENAVKYGGSADVALARSPDAVEIIISDDGPGLPEPEVDQVLEPFYRVEASRSRETGGSGLGLAIARAVAEAHGGTLRLANRPEGGLCATIALPAC